MGLLDIFISVYFIGVFLSVLVLKLLYKKGLLKGVITTGSTSSEPDEMMVVILIVLWPISILAGVCYPIGWLLSKAYDSVIHFIFK